MSDQYAIVLDATKKIEALLTKIGADGRGLTEKCRSVERFLPEDIVFSIKHVAKIRNRLVHEDGARVQNIPDFLHHAGSAAVYLEQLAAPEPVRKGLTINFPPNYQEALRAQASFLEWYNSPAREQAEREAREGIEALQLALRGIREEIDKIEIAPDPH